MPLTIVSTVGEFAEVNHVIPYIPPSDTDALIILNDRPSLRFIGDVVRILVEQQPLPSKILISSYAEPSDYDYLQALNSIVTSLNIADRIAIYDAGQYLEQYGNIKTIIYSPWWLTPYPNYIPKPFEQRSTKFSCLNRVPRYHRVKIVDEIIKEGLLDQGLVSCGSKGPGYNYSMIVPAERLHYYPMTPFAEQDAINSDELIFAPDKEGKQLDCLINVVSESSCESIWPDFKECWARCMLTEKTTKAFLSQQLPIFLASSGYVHYLRTMGFDVFDDIVSHHYDNILNPNERIPLIVAELKRLVSMPLQDMQDLFKQHEHRFVHNRQLVSKLNEMLTQRAKDRLKNWFDDLQ